MPTDLPELRDKWRRRLSDAKLRLVVAQALTKDSLQDCESEVSPASNAARDYAWALYRERDALAEFDRVAGILQNLIFYDTIPDEDREQETKGRPD